VLNGRSRVVVVTAFCAVVVGCAPAPLAARNEAAAAAGLDPAALVDLGGSAAAARRAGGRVELVFVHQSEGEWTASVVNSHPEPRTDWSVHLLTYGGDTDEEWNSFIYGVAPAGAERIQIAGMESAGGQVHRGSWVVAVREKQLAPDDLGWKFLDRGGAVIREGRGIGPPAA
jgi:hypothetical protein